MVQEVVCTYLKMIERLERAFSDRSSVRQVALILFASLIGSSVFAKEVDIGAAQVSLTTPPGYCELDSRNEHENRLIAGMQTLLRLNRLLASYADCQQLVSFRSGPAALLDDFTLVTTPIASEAAIVSEAVVRQLCSKLRSQGAERLAEITRDGNARLDHVFKGAKLNEAGFLGVLVDDKAACYWAQITKIRTEVGTERALLGISTVMVIKGKLIGLSSFTTYVSNAPIGTLLRRQQVYAAAFSAANKR